jgi:hypothetical protein
MSSEQTLTNQYAGPYCPLQDIPGWKWLAPLFIFLSFFAFVFLHLSFFIRFRTSYLRTPSFPEYISGHSTFSAAAAEALKLYTGSDNFPEGLRLAFSSLHSCYLGTHFLPGFIAIFLFLQDLGKFS